MSTPERRAFTLLPLALALVIGQGFPHAAPEEAWSRFRGPNGTGIVADPALGGQGFFDYTVFPAVPGTYDMAAQVITQIKAVGITVVWTGVVSAVLFYALKFTLGLRPSEEAEREGLDLSEHGERAYNY